MKRLIDIGVLEYLMSPWAARSVFVPRKDSGRRITTDFRALDNVTEMDAYFMRDAHLTLNWLISKKRYSIFDLIDDFIQVVLDDVSRPLRAVRTVLGLQYDTMLPRGLKTLHSTFQRTV